MQLGERTLDGNIIVRGAAHGKSCYCCRRCAIYGADMTICEDRESYPRIVCEIYSLVPAAKGISCRRYAARPASEFNLGPMMSR